MEEMMLDNVMTERLELALERIGQIPEECKNGETENESFRLYFERVADFLQQIKVEREFLLTGGFASAELEELQKRNHALYADVLPENYETSYANPAYAVACLGDDFGAMLAFLYREMRSLIPFVYENREEEIAIRLELFVEVYGCFTCAWQDGIKPKKEDVRQIIYWFVSDYTETATERHLEEMLLPEGNFAIEVIKRADLSNVRYLYTYGEYITENELETARFLAALPEETICTMADTYTEGYRIGFEVTNKDLSKKTTVEIRYQLGFERMMRRAVENFEKMGLQVVCYRAATSILYNPSIYKVGFYGGEVNRQYDFDHKDDRALFFDKTYMNHRLEVTRTAFERLKEAARGYAGPAVLETFGEHGFEPKNKPEALHMSDEQNALFVEYRSLAGELQRNYILEEERSFTIIAFPIPEIMDSFDEVLLEKLGVKTRQEAYHAFFEDIIKINTLDYEKYRKVQQCIIDTLDTADYCEIRGMNGNRTNLTINLWKLADPSKETIFENCVADVNIPVGEVFTSPVLKGTNGVLYVSRVFLNGLEYRDLEITFEDGKITEYNCSNFATKEENQKFIWENVLFRHKTLPIGEFAIGTNTLAYTVARKYQVQDKMPILIAEKTGPHFAVGDTCYSHAEDVKVYNPDGKEIVARDNEVAKLRDKAPKKAYFNCHTDITIPYDELGELAAVRKDGSREVIIKEGKFVLPGTEMLNEAL